MPAWTNGPAPPTATASTWRRRLALSDDDTAVVIGTAPADLLVRAAEACPSVAISVIDEDTGEQIYP